MAVTDNAANTAALPPTPHALAYDTVKIQDIVSLGKWRGIIFLSSKIYNSFVGFFKYVLPITMERLRRGRRSQWSLHSASRTATAVL